VSAGTSSEGKVWAATALKIKTKVVRNILIITNG
jgi:hypothetical protein